MSFAEVAKNPPTPRRGTAGCSIGILLAELPDDERDGLQALLDNPRIPHTGNAPADQPPASIEDIIRREGHDVSVTMIGTHRRGTCGCVARNR